MTDTQLRYIVCGCFSSALGAVISHWLPLVGAVVVAVGWGLSLGTMTGLFGWEKEP